MYIHTYLHLVISVWENLFVVFVIHLALMGALVNSMVHSIMYTYYGLTAFGPSIRKYIGKYKKRVTQLQLVRPKLLYVRMHNVILSLMENVKYSY